MIQTMATEAQHFARRWFHNQPQPSLLVLTGVSGCGKTHTAKGLFRFALQSSYTAFQKGGWKRGIPSTLFLSWPETTDTFKAGNYGVVDDCFKEGLLVIDDIGAEHDPSRNSADKLCQILTRRERKFTVITTNIVPSAWPERFDVRIADRLMRNSVVVDLSDATSYALV
ncbi:MAG TPA: ATP-binding protein [Candidatus Angelobacter sp.]|nr:ATP-binding protein [Candidatus Angelobacter sp.]